MGGKRIDNAKLERLLKLRRTRSVRETAKMLELSPKTVQSYCGKQLAEVLRRWKPPVKSENRDAGDAELGNGPP
jgi:hypothetical protein